LALGILLSVGALGFSFLMSGMRHSYPADSQLDAYYWLPGLPLLFTSMLYATTAARVSKRALQAVGTVAALVIVFWLILVLSEEGLLIGAVSFAYGITVFTCWLALRKTHNPQSS
jgi:hypothetical protein